MLSQRKNQGGQVSSVRAAVPVAWEHPHKETGVTQTCRCPVQKTVSPVISASEMGEQSSPKNLPWSLCKLPGLDAAGDRVPHLCTWAVFTPGGGRRFILPAALAVWSGSRSLWLFKKLESGSAFFDLLTGA